MLELDFYYQSQSIYSLDFVQLDQCEQATIIVPSPAIADIYRAKIQQSSSIDFDVITISKFIKDLFKDNYDSEVLERFKGKAELIMNLSVIWKNAFPGESYEVFMRAYNLLTDFRSFTLDPIILESILDEYDPILKKAVKYFYKIMIANKFIDEHESYFILADFFREMDGDEGQNKNYVFLGFNFFSGAQIDFIKALSIKNNVHIPFSKIVFDQAIQTDWIKWVADYNLNKVEIDEPINKEYQVNRLGFSKKHLAETLKNYFEENKVSEGNIYLGTKNCSISNFSEIPLNNKIFKCSTDILAESISILSAEIENKFFENRDNTIDIDDFDDYVIEFVKEKSVITKGDSASTDLFVKKDFRWIKVFSLVRSYLKEWMNLSESNNKVTYFDQKILFDFIRLKSPRNFFLPQEQGEQNFKIFDINAIENYEKDKVNYIIASAEYSGLKSNRPGNSEKVEKFLTSIGPVRRSEFEFLILKDRIKEVLGLENTVLFIEDGLAKHDLAWNGILSEFTPSEIEVSKKAVDECSYQFLENKKDPYVLKNISASKLQTYIDCPKKFYYSYVERMSPYIELNESLGFNHLGIIEHDIIDKYCTKYDDWDEVNHFELCTSIFNTFLKVNNKTISSVSYQIFFTELINYSRQGIFFVLSLKSVVIGLEVQFEHELVQGDDIQKKVIIDCYAVNDKLNVLLDFKRSGGGVPRKTSLCKLEKIQIWFYLNFLTQYKYWDEDKPFLIGYINLSKVKDSFLLTNDEVLYEEFLSMQIVDKSRIYLFNEEWKEAFSNYRKMEGETIKTLSAGESSFPVLPKNKDVCKYCAIQNVCSKSEMGVS